MRSARVRSRGVTETLAATAVQAPSDADAAFEELYRSSRDDVYAYVAELLRDRSAAEDVTAQAFERAYRRRRTFNPGRGSRRAWLFGIARNAALDELRRRRRGAQLVAEPEDEGATVPHEEAEPAGGAAYRNRRALPAGARARRAQVLRRPDQRRDRRRDRRFRDQRRDEAA